MITDNLEGRKSKRHIQPKWR